MKNQNSKKKLNLYTKLTIWCAAHKIPMVVFPFLILVILALILVIILGNIQHWDYAGALTSNGAYLAYVIIFLVIAVVVILKIKKHLGL